MTLARRHALAGALALSLAAVLPAGAADGDMTLGPAKAKVTVIEYASVTCPHCARFHAEVFPQLKARYIDTGRIRFVLRELPTEPAELSMAGFLAARCAGPKYFTVIDALMETQAALWASRDARTWLMSAAAKAGVGEAAAEACMTNADAVNAFNARVDANVEALPVSGTPTIFVNGQLVGSGEISFAEIEAAIARAAAKRKPKGR